MPKIVSIHEYTLKPDASETEFEKAFREAEERGLFQIPGLAEYHLLKGIRGKRQNVYAAMWIYESKEVWEKLWGSVEYPKEKTEYPDQWKIWENEILSRYLDRDPDKIEFTTYQVQE